ncbi:MAG TPA: dihydrofolate reductase family protein [Puia sp.]|nr:dihydrofolate reductase family protein [Puia sp.]
MRWSFHDPMGGPMLAGELLRAGLADEIRMSVLPKVLGEGTLFFDHPGLEQALHLKDVTAYRNGMVELRYEIKR